METGHNGPLTARTKARWERLANHYGFVEFLSEWYLKARRKGLWSLAGGHILEAGVGTGLNLPFYPAGSTVMATDFSGAMLRKARQRAAERTINVQFQEADICHLPFPDKTFDTTVETFVFCSLRDPVPCLKELSRVTKPGGQILLLDHVRIDRPLIGTLMDRFNTVTVRHAGEYINHRMIDLVRSAGLEIIESRRIGFFGIIQFIIARPQR